MNVFFFGVGYCAETLIRRTPSITPSGTVRSDARAAALRGAGVETFVFDGTRADPGLEAAIGRADALVVSIPPGPNDPLDAFARTINASRRLQRILYYSTVGVYGNYCDDRVNEKSVPMTNEPRAIARLRDEARWKAAGAARGSAVDVVRLPGIYGPGRNALDRLRAGDARRIVKPGHVTNRAHVDDIAEATRLILTRRLTGQIWNVVDDEPAPPQDVIAFAAQLLGVPCPPDEPYETAELSPMTASFYAETKRVVNLKVKKLLRFAPAYPTYREGLRALWEAGEGRA
ncbi:NAD-dependent epimerase/dehydratase family protein [Roseiarcus fermentans]|uniref:NAD-dependent epimerase/dehydratase family protein n=1 Tax=Roseiarcus fermentans TaxID=1473586 RepID=UPI000DEBD98B|nr:NAD-dependent epimerase/dehydratase family protein [Roseiarcus fermentans]